MSYFLPLLMLSNYYFHAIECEMTLSVYLFSDFQAKQVAYISDQALNNILKPNC